MKVWLGDKAHANSGGMFRVYDGLYKYLPQHGLEIVAEKQDADVLNPHIGMWGNFPGDKPVVLSSHGMLWEEHGWGRLADKVNAECLASYRRADVVTAPSNFVSRAIARYTGASPVLAHHGINSTEWVPGDSSDYVLWNKARADIASDPAEMNALAELAPDTMFYSTHGQDKNNVHVFGTISPEDMKEVVSQAGIYLALSKESGGPCFGVLEAMSCGVPVLSWDFGGTAEAISHKENGYLAAPHDYDDLLEGLRYCQSNRNRLGYNARQLVIDEYQWEHTIFGYIEAYERAFGGWNNTVDIIIPCYNLGEFLPGCIESAINQTYPHVEVIVVDDASTDNSRQIIEDYASKYDNVTGIYHANNHHVSHARNSAIRWGEGNFVLPLDADDRLYPDAVATLVAELQHDRHIDIATGKLHIYHETELDNNYQMSGWPNNTSLKMQLEGFNRLPYSSMYRRKVFNRVGGYRTRIRNGVEDADFWTRALALGYEATVLDKATLRYTHREESLGKQNAGGSAVWLNWFPWIEETSPARATQVNNFDPPAVSVIIPVGPGHRKYVQACIDSIIAQTEENWEIVLVNDSGLPLPDVPGFVRVVDYGDNQGVACARNRGVEAAAAERIVFLDVDDILQPHALQALIAAHAYAGGWVYGDWYINKGDGDIEYSEAENWNYDLILQRSLGPITGIYEKKHILQAGGFDEDIAGWEDWDFHLRLLHQGVCGTRLKTALITYNMHLGWRREDNFSNRDNLLKYIEETHYKPLKDKRDMACGSCGGGRTLTISTNTPKATRDTTMEDMVRLVYTGPQSQTVTYNSKKFNNVKYRVKRDKPFNVFVSDVEFFLSVAGPKGEKHFKRLNDLPTAKKEQPIEVKEAPLVSQEVPTKNMEISSFSSEHLENIGLEEHVVTKLSKGGYLTVGDIQKATDTELMTVKGIGSQRVDEIREIIDEWIMLP